jgi:acetyl/propionyl-CoA carboxylase alpha subunit
MEGGMIIRAEWPGYIVDVLVAPGQEVEEDETLMLLEGTDATHTPFAEEDDDLVELAEIE